MSNSSSEQPVHTAEVILIPKRLRMDWIDLAALDKELPPASFKIGAVIGTHFDNKSGLTYVSQETLAKVSGLSAATVARAIADLERRGYLIVQRREIGVRSDGRRVFGGKGVANVYLPALDGAQICATDGRAKKLSEAARQRWDESAKHITGDVLNQSKDITRDVLCGHQSTSKDVAKHITGDVPTLASPSGKNSFGTTPRVSDPAAPPDALGIAGQHLKWAIGSDLYAAWFGKVTVVSDDGSTVVLSVPTAFWRDYIATEFESKILRAWQKVRPAVAQISIVVRQGRAQ
jgi:hypothetical protein